MIITRIALTLAIMLLIGGLALMAFGPLLLILSGMFLAGLGMFILVSTLLFVPLT